jgi:DnaK suppressor protein
VDESTLERLRARLLQMRAELLTTDDTARDAARPVTLDQSSVGRVSRMDAMQGQAMAVAAQQRRALQLRGIEAALARIDAGEFGICQSCGKDIDPRRLEFDPTAALCIACANALEKR